MTKGKIIYQCQDCGARVEVSSVLPLIFRRRWLELELAKACMCNFLNEDDDDNEDYSHVRLVK